ncbi:YwqH-like family protein [Paraliobacillus ryukyuensis]|uniref:YwqH-like family protein n=1 Tax=Paraliobacillus ryukyuensis TaxID=200904 RepID=UPI0009A809C5|nr:DUF5082 family protein [Paraliobacillus ryukyuensis]
MVSSLSYLRSRKYAVQREISSCHDRVAELEEKIARLKEAIQKLSTVLSDIDSIKSSINQLTINATNWRGENEKEFDTNYDQYKDSIESYVKDTEDAKDIMNDDIRRYEAKRDALLIRISNLESELSSINVQIRREMREDD